MKLNHLNLTVTDITKTHDFFQTYFGLRSLSENKNMAFLLDDDGVVLSLMDMKVALETEVKYPATFRFYAGERGAGKQDQQAPEKR